MRIRSIRKITTSREFVDIGVRNNHNFFANGVLTHNCSLPARNVIICGTERGISDVDVADIIQEAGRAGRLGMDPKGDCFLLGNNIPHWSRLILNPPPVTSQLLNPVPLRFQILTEVYMGTITCRENLTDWFNKTLAAVQSKYPRDLFINAVKALVEWGMLVEDEGTLRPTKLGIICVRSYFTPDDVRHWAQTLMTKSEVTDELLSILIGYTPSMVFDYIPKQYAANVDGFVRKLNKCPINWRGINGSPFMAWVVSEHLNGEAMAKGLSFYLRALTQDAPRILGAMTQISKILETPHNFDSISPRIIYGVKAELVELCNIPHIGGKRAYLLYLNNIKNASDFRKADRAKLDKILGAKIAASALSDMEPF